MPFTPFHLGPAAIIKGLAGDRFSFMVFGGSQVLMDIEPGVRMVLGSPVLHGPTHTIGGALAIAIIASLIGKPISEFALRVIAYPDSSISWSASITGAFFGTLSHIILDAVMHSDMIPWAPFASSNELLGLLSLTSLHTICVFSGFVGGILVFIRFKIDRDA